MIINKKIFSFLIICFLILRVEGQDYDRLCKKALQINNAGKRHVYKYDDNSICITYLGKILTNKKIGYKLVSLKNSGGINSHTNGYLWVYDIYNKFVGRYVLGDARDLPIKLEKNKLTFTNENKDCKVLVKKEISFYYGLPKQIFIPACGAYGDFYQLYKNKK